MIGGDDTEKRILSFNVNDHKFKVMPFQLNVGRSGHRCAFIPNTNKIMITGAYDNGILDSTEILDTEGEKVTMASPMNLKRLAHGMGVFTINGEDRLAVFGGLESLGRGNDLDSVELYNTQTETWENSDIRLNEPKMACGNLTIKLGDIMSKL